MPGSCPSFTIYPLCEYGVTLQFSAVISEAVLQQISHYHTLLTTAPFPGFIEAVPAYTTLSVFYDPLQLKNAAGLLGKHCFQKVCNYLNQLQNVPVNKTMQSVNRVSIPVCYGGKYGPDLEQVARHKQLSLVEVIHLHSNAIYKVYMMGFVPGFAYLGGLNEQLATPRKTTPQQKIPAGSVGIAGGQTGIYPLETPGGWQVIGRTPLQLFDASRQKPSLLQAGDEVIFTEISPQEFSSINQRQHANKNPSARPA